MTTLVRNKRWHILLPYKPDYRLDISETCRGGFFPGPHMVLLWPICAIVPEAHTFMSWTLRVKNTASPQGWPEPHRVPREIHKCKLGMWEKTLGENTVPTDPAPICP